MAVWHGRTLMPIFFCRGMGILAITSLSQDGEIQTGIVSRLGYSIIRGSSGRGGMKAALIASKKLKAGGILSITPDGPKGPHHEVHDGIVFLAERAGCPIIPLGVGVDRKILMNAWDKYLIPMPFSKCAIVFGEPFRITQVQENEDAKHLIRCALDACEKEAEMLVSRG